MNGKREDKNMYECYLKKLREDLPLGESFDILERKITVGGRRASIFFTDGLTDGAKTEIALAYFMNIEAQKTEGVKTSSQLMEEQVPFLDSSLVEPKNASEYEKDRPELWSEAMIADCCAQAEEKMYAGLTPLVVEGTDKIIIMDMREYPGRSVSEPEKEKSLRGAKDGFTENVMENVSMIRRRIRDNDLIFKHNYIGRMSKTDVVVSYMKNKVDKKMLARLEEELASLDAENLTVGDQSLLERLLKSFGAYSRVNPFPKVRYSQRPDVIAAHIVEGKIAVIVDNSPTVMLLPVGIFDFLQDIDDYYFPQITGNYFRLLRTINFMVILFLTPIYMLIIEYEEFTPQTLRFFVPEENFAVPVLLQFILLEIAIDGLKLASLNTPESLGTSLSVIGALIMGEFSISSGWFIPQTILCMAVVALASFTQPSIELSYGIKYARVIMILGAGLLGIWGFLAGAAVSLVFLATTKTLSGDSYLYPLVPFKWKALKRLLFRTEK